MLPVEAYHTTGFRNLVLLLLAAWLVTGCRPISSQQPYENELYENAEAGIRLERPENWDLAYNERNGVVVLVAEEGVLERKLARIEIQGPACGPEMGGYESPEAEVEWNIYRIGMLYALEAVVVQEPISTKVEDYEFTQAIIRIPTAALQDDSARNQVGDQSPNVFQTIELFAITSNGHTIMAYIYLGNSDALNVQARDIIDSIQLDCLTEE